MQHTTRTGHPLRAQSYNFLSILRATRCLILFAKKMEQKSKIEYAVKIILQKVLKIEKLFLSSP